MMPASAVQTKSWFRPNGWFNDREISIVVNRVLRDDPSKGDMHNRQAITPTRLWNAVKDYHLWPLYIIGFLAYIPQSPPNTYLTLTLRSVGFSTFTTNLLVIPSSVFHIMTLLLLTRLSEWVDERSLVAMLQPLWTLPCIVALRFWPGIIENAWGTYALVTVLLSYPYCHGRIHPSINFFVSIYPELLTWYSNRCRMDISQLQQCRHSLRVRSSIQCQALPPFFFFVHTTNKWCRCLSK